MAASRSGSSPRLRGKAPQGSTSASFIPATERTWFTAARDGNKLGELVYRDGKATGTLVEVDDDGRPLRKVEYREGEIVAHEDLPTGSDPARDPSEVEAGR